MSPIEASVRRARQRMRLTLLGDDAGADIVAVSGRDLSMIVLAQLYGNRAERVYDEVQELIDAQPSMRMPLQLSGLNKCPAVLAEIAALLPTPNV
jgi:hypothetical protein